LYRLNRLREFSSFFVPVRIVSTQLTSSHPFPLLGVASRLTDVVTLPLRVTVPSHWAKMSSLPSLHLSATLCPAALSLESKLKHWIRGLPSSDRLTPTIHWYKKIISILVTLSTTQPCFYFTSSIVRAPRHRSSTRRHHSLSLLSYTYHPFAQRHTRWWTSCLSFFF
jgi:hypothetical protein